LTRGQPAGDSFEEKDKDRSVGFFKGCIRILDFNPLDDPNKPPPPPPEERAVEGGAAEGGAEGELLQPGGDHPAPSPAPLSDRGELAAGSEAGGASVARSEAGSETGSLVLSREETFSTVSQVRDHYNFKELLGEPKKYKVRCYVMRALGLAPMDEGSDGSPGKSDPYLRANLGKKTYDNQAGYVEDTVSADFFECLELDAELPGAPLVLEVMDYDGWGSDDLIGRTVVDLEDRWFDDTWQKLGEHTRCSTPGAVRWSAKPVEIRPLYTPSQQQPQGHVELWVDILAANEAGVFPPDDIALPPPKKFEVRVVVWQARDCVSMDSFSDSTDSYVVCGIHGCPDQATDVHWRAKKGKPSWNYRLKFDVDLGLKTPSYKFPYLKVQLWDKDIFKWDDMLAETQMDLGYYFKKAFRQAQKEDTKLLTIKVFEDPPTGAAAAKGKAKEDDEIKADLNDFRPIPPEDHKIWAPLFVPVHESMFEVAQAGDEVASSLGLAGDRDRKLVHLVGKPEYSNGGGGGDEGTSDLEGGHTGPKPIRDSTPLLAAPEGGGMRGRDGEADDGEAEDGEAEEEEEEEDPSGWRVYDAAAGNSDGKPYYWNVETRQAQWRKPSEVKKWEKLQAKKEAAKEKVKAQKAAEEAAARAADPYDGWGQARPPPRPTVPRMRKKKKPKRQPGDGCDVFCCLRCCCRGCCAVMTCKCCSPAEPPLPPPEGGGGKEEGPPPPPPPDPSLAFRVCPSLFGHGACRLKYPCLSGLLRCLCAVLRLAAKLAALFARLAAMLLYCVGKCVGGLCCGLLLTACPCLAVCCKCCNKEEDEWEEVPPGEPLDPGAADEEAEEEAKNLGNNASAMFGRGPDPPDSGWMQLDRQSPKEPGEREPMGRLNISIEIVPLEVAVANQVGFGRQKPNRKPFLPPPPGRLKWSWNPFLMGSQILGPKCCCYITCALVGAVFVVLSIYCQPFVNIVMWIFLKATGLGL